MFLTIFQGSLLTITWGFLTEMFGVPIVEIMVSMLNHPNIVYAYVYRQVSWTKLDSKLL